MNVWVEELKADYFRVCLREVKTFDGKHQNLKVASLTRIVLVHRTYVEILWFCSLHGFPSTNSEVKGFRKF